MLVVEVGAGIESGHIKPRAAHSGQIRADQSTGSALFELPVRTAMHGKSRALFAIKYDFLKLDDSRNCIIRKTWLHCI